MLRHDFINASIKRKGDSECCFLSKGGHQMSRSKCLFKGSMFNMLREFKKCTGRHFPPSMLTLPQTYRCQ